MPEEKLTLKHCPFCGVIPMKEDKDLIFIQHDKYCALYQSPFTYIRIDLEKNFIKTWNRRSAEDRK